MLELFHSFGAPWWLSIVLLTVMVRAALLPLTLRQVRSVRAMQEMRPEMEEIRRRHKDDRRKQQEAMMELYGERRINPLAGYLPLLVQVPVFITMYQVVRIHEETFPSFASGGLLWFNDLTVYDPYYALPVISAAILVAAQEVSASNVRSGQKNMMRLLPIGFTAFIARFPTGLFVYWITSNAFTFAQNCAIYRRQTDLTSPPTPDDPPRTLEASPVRPEPASSSTKRSAKKTRGKRKRKKSR
jgi:YidC/Oxa1 family membrane protein insertase